MKTIFISGVVRMLKTAFRLKSASRVRAGRAEQNWEGRKEGGGLFVGCLTSQQHASVSQGRICLDSFTCCHTEIEVADQAFNLT